MRFEIHVRPGASETRVGGQHDGVLVVRVVEPADAGRATDAALRAVAKAMERPPGSVTLVRGSTSRRKLIDVDAGPGESESVTNALQRLKGQTGD